MKRHARQSSVPEFLQNNPYLPVGRSNDRSHAKRVGRNRPRPRGSLNYKRTGIFLLGGLGAFFVLYCFWSVYRLIALRWFSGPRCLQNTPVTPPISYPDTEDFDWSQFAYTQYATNTDYLCNSVMAFETLERLGSKPDRLLLYSSTFSLVGNSTDTQLLLKARDEYGAKLVPVEIVRKANAYVVWAESFTKLLAFNQTQYKRVLVLDSDATMLKHMDELFFLPEATTIVPRAYWLEKPYLSSHVMLISPSATEFARVQTAIAKADKGTYDMDIVNALYGKTCSLLPHRTYALLTGEFRSKSHVNYLGKKEKWDPIAAIREAKFVHFSDYPVPKPWYEAEWQMIEKRQPACVIGRDGKEDCSARYIWLDLYTDFKERRKSVCGLELGPDPMH